jgi:hypothetical protein
VEEEEQRIQPDRDVLRKSEILGCGFDRNHKRKRPAPDDDEDGDMAEDRL